MRKILGTAIATAIFGSMSLLSLSGVAQAGTTNTTFTVSGGALSITVPGTTASLGTAGTGGSTSASLGTVAVTDVRGALAATWTSLVSASNFTGTSHSQVIAVGQATYLPGLTTASSGIPGTFVPGNANVAFALSTAGATAYTGASVGSNSASWDPTLTVSIPTTAVADIYTGTVTHTVS